MTDDGRAARYSDLFGGGEGHAHGGECSVCPICAGLAVLRNTNPEVVEHLAAAARELVAAAGLLVAEAERVTGTTTAAREQHGEGGGIRHIDVG